MSLLLLWNGPNFTPPVEQAKPDRFRIATPLTTDDDRFWLGEQTEAVPTTVVETTAPPVRKVLVRPLPPFERIPWQPPVPEVAPSIPEEIEVLVTAPVVWDDEDDEAVLMMLGVL